MRKRIAILTYSLAGGGAERTIANVLNQLDRNKYDIRLVLMNTDIEYSIPDDQVIHFIEKSDRNESDILKFIKIPFLAYKFYKYCRKENIDLVFAVMNRPNMVATMAKGFGLKCKVLISEQFYTPYLYNRSSFINRVKRSLLIKCYRNADCILPNSEGTAHALKNEFDILTDYRVIKNPTDLATITAMKDEPVNDVDLSKFTFVNVAAFRPEKNQELIIDAISKLTHRNFQLIFIGKGTLADALQKKVDEMGLTDIVRFIPFTGNPFKYLSKCDCFVLSSFVEGFPNILIESMVCNLPIIAVDCKTGPRELLAAGTDFNRVIKSGEIEIAEYGILTAVNSVESMVKAMDWALSNSEALNAYKEKSSDRVKEFDIKRSVDDIAAIFEEYL